MRTFALAIMVCASGFVVAATGDPIEPTLVTPGFGSFENEEGATLVATETETGGEVVNLSPGEFRQPRVFQLHWDHDGWSEVTFVAEVTELSGNLNDLADVLFAPYGMDGGVKVATNGETIYRVPPSPLPFWYQFRIGVDVGLCEDCVGEFRVSYSLTEADPPVPGDFDFADLVGFADFLILADNFGSSREPSMASAVPEPSGALPLFVSLSGLLLYELARKRA